MKTVWNFDLLSSMSEVSTEQAKEEWEKLKDSKEESNQNKLELLMARIAFQEILYVSKNMGLTKSSFFPNLT